MTFSTERGEDYSGPGQANYANPYYVNWKIKQADKRAQESRDKIDAAMWRMQTAQQQYKEKDDIIDAEYSIIEEPLQLEKPL